MLNPSINRFRLAVLCPHPEDGTSFYRAFGPLSAMVKQDARLELVCPRQVPGRGWDLSWEWIAGCHAVFMQRPWLDVHLQFAKLCRSMDLPLWLDWDDDHTCVPQSNPHFPTYSDPDEIRRVRDGLCGLANAVSVTTVALQRRIQGPNCGTRVVPNARMWKYYDEPRQRRVSWRGGNSHVEDVLSVLKQIDELARLPQLGKWNWFFMGDVPWCVEQAVPHTRLEICPGAGLTFYVALLALQAPYVHICPLKQNRFNPCKSNIAWLEAACAGAVTIAPDWPEWDRPGALKYRDAHDFGRVLKETMEGFDGKMHPGVAAARAYIDQHLTLGKVNQQRWEIINELYEIGGGEGIRIPETGVVADAGQR